MNDRITLCLDRDFSVDLASALRQVLEFDEDCCAFDESVTDVLDDLLLVLDIHLNCKVF